MRNHIDTNGKVKIYDQETGKEYYGFAVDAHEVMKFGGWGFAPPDPAKKRPVQRKKKAD